ncbi:BnaC02g34660D [Brassica napus]|uniref:BnaC02g34660D protein n=1 Tax=Brassica napus TaxID=3708 RepID=A0A078HY75_BRANA|nr:BnaC02g34660D [Brassica napus]
MFSAVEDSPRPRKKARKEAPAEASEEAAAEAREEGHTTDIADAMREGFGTCLKEIKYLSERVEAVEKKGHHLKTLPLHLNRRSNPGVKLLMGRTREGRAWRRIKVQMCPQLCPQMLVPRKIKLQNRALRRMLDIRKREMLLWHFAQSPYAANITARKKLKELADWLKTCPTPLDKKPFVYVEDLPHIDAWNNVLRKRYDVNPQYFRSERMCFLDHLFAQQWRFNFKDFRDSEPDQNGTIPSFYQSNKRHIVVFDSICSNEQRAQYSLEPFTYERPTNIPQARAGDCGVYTLKRLTVKSSGMLDDLTITSLESLLSSDLLARPSQICLVVQFDKEVDSDKFITQIFNT